LESAITKLIQELRAKTWKIEDDDSYTSFTKDLKRFIAHTQTSERTVRVLKSLHFKQLKERQSEIRQAHTHTFEWVFDLQSTSNFPSWLQSGNDIYWIEGKPGSGKSTLINFLISNHKTTGLLRRWSGAKPRDLVK
jgi:tRNA U34 5-carboxymethylaminomethyl modifying GTPase MnmE/TrmE